MSDVAMPRLSDSMEEGTILKWLKSDGDEVKRGEELVEIETDKANMTYEADTNGVLQIVANEGDTLPVGEVIARIGEGAAGDEGSGEKAESRTQKAEEEASAEPEPEEEAPDEDEAPDEEEAPAKEAPAPARAERVAAASSNGGGDGRVKASPVARRMAREMGLELASMQGSGPGGRIVKSDVEAAAQGGGVQAPERPAEEAPAPAREQEPEPAAPEPEAAQVKAPPPPEPVVSGDGQTAKGDVEVRELSRLQQTIARRMAESKATAPDFQLQAQIDMERCVELRAELKRSAGEGDVVPSFNDFVVKASALALREFPRANGSYRDGKFELYSRVNVGIAVAAQEALVVPTVFDADRKSVGQIARDSRALAERVRAGVISPPELSGGTFTVSNLGMYGISNFAAVINPPQAAILAVGALTPTPVVRDRDVVVRHMMGVTLSCDHRILYGADAAEFLGRIRALLEEPLRLAL